MNKETDETIREIMDVLQSGEFDSKRQLENLTAKLEKVFAPAIALEDLRFEQIGEMLYKFTWDSRRTSGSHGLKSGSLPILRFDNERLEKFLLVLERHGVLEGVILSDPLWEVCDGKTERYIHKTLKSLKNSDLEHEKAVCIKLLAKFLGDATLNGMLNSSLPHMVSSKAFNLVHEHSRMDTYEDGSWKESGDWQNGSQRVIDYRSLGEKFLEARVRESEELDNPQFGQLHSIISALAFYSEDPHKARVSQKARGIQTLSDSASNLWITKPSIPVSLETALTTSDVEVGASIKTMWGPHTVEKFWKDGCFIRTCPEDPRSGALENSHTFNLEDACKDLRGLAAVMLDDTKPDFDPYGELVIMKFEKPTCSAVVVKGHRHISVGPIHDGATNTRGTLIHLYLSNDGSYNIVKAVRDLKMEDGMKYHEIEFVWGEDDGPAAAKQQMQYKLSQSRYQEEHLPTCTQVRGLRMDKEPLFPPAVVDGEMLHIRGAVPDHEYGEGCGGTTSQKTFIDVEKGDLSDCMELEQMAKKGTLPEGLVVYASAGGPMCHAAGVSREFGFPIVYGQQPFANGTLWTEVQGWMCYNNKDVEAKPYDPTLMTEYFHIGMEDGDKFWDFGNVALSTFLHTYMSSGVNDPRFEAYLGGVYSMWLVKATLATSLGEMRHAYDGKATLDPHISLKHLLSVMSLIEDDEDFSEFDWNDRSEYYNLLKRKKVGLPYLKIMLENCSICFEDSEWSGSFGGPKYMESVEAAIECCTFMMAFGDGDVDVNKVLGKVNKLENAVHNTGGFFNKFVRNKYWFDMATKGGHDKLGYVSWQYHVAAVFHTRFYRRIVEEPWVCYDGYKEDHEAILHDDKVEILGDEEIKVFGDLMSSLHTGGDLIEYDGMSKALMTLAVSAYCQPASTYCEDCDSSSCGCYGNYTKKYHKTGICSLKGCPNEDCKEAVFATQYGLKPYEIDTVKKAFSLPLGMHVIPVSFKKIMGCDEPIYHIRGGFSLLSADFHKVKVALPLTKEGVDGLDVESQQKLMALGPLGTQVSGDYHTDSNIWVEPTREKAAIPMIETKAHSFGETSSVVTRDLPAMIEGSLEGMDYKYMWMDATTHELVRRVFRIWDEHYGIKRDYLYISEENIEAEKRILRDIMGGGHDEYNMEYSEINMAIFEGLGDFVQSVVELFGSKTSVISASEYLGKGNWDSPIKKDINVSLTAYPTPLWLSGQLMPESQTAYYYSTAGKGLYFTLLLEYFHYLHEEAYNTLIEGITNTAVFADKFISRYGTDFVKEILQIKENGNNE